MASVSSLGAYYQIAEPSVDVFQMFFAPWDITLNEWISSCHLTQGTGCECYISRYDVRFLTRPKSTGDSTARF